MESDRGDWFGTALLKAACVLVCGLAGLASSTALGQPSDPAHLLQGIPGFDFSRLPPHARQELATVLTDEFDACGRPLTLLASLKKGDACRHTRRVVSLAAAFAAEGSSANEIIVQLSRYNQSFSKPRTSFKLDARTCVGPSDAKVTLVEFSDFECPVCAAVRPQLERLLKERPQVRLCWSAFPLEMHRYASLCGQAALFARDAGKFWAVHDGLFARQPELSEDVVRHVLKGAGLDVKAFDKAVAAGAYLDELKASKDAGLAAAVGGTPTLFVNGRQHVLGFAMETLTTSADDELDWRSGNGAWPAN